MADDEQRVRTTAGWIGVEISRSRVRTEGKAGYGLYRVRGSAARTWRETRELPRSAVTEDLHGERGPWTPYVFTLDMIRICVDGAIEAGTPAGPGPMLLRASGHGWSATVPTRWTSAYTGRRDLGVRTGTRWDEKAERLGGMFSYVLGGPVGLAACGCPNRVDGTEPMLHICRRCGFESGPDLHTRCSGCAYLAARAGVLALEPVRVKGEYAAELGVLTALVGAGLMTMTHVEGCSCSGITEFSVACVRASMTVEQRRRADNAVFHAEHLERRVYGNTARHAAKERRLRGGE